MKQLTIGCLLAAGIFASCNNAGENSTKTDTKDSTTVTSSSASDSSKKDTGMNANTTISHADSTKMNSTTATVPVDEKTVKFVQTAASGGMMEVELGKLSQEKAKNQRVKDFGSMMTTDHTNANNELKSLATAKNIMIPATMSPKDQKHYDMMSKMSGSSFDKAYMDMMVNDHKADIGEFKKASDNLKDADIKGFAAKTLPTLQKHLDSAKAIHHKM